MRRVIALDESGANRLFVIFGEGEKAGVFDFDGAKAPAPVQSLRPPTVLLPAPPASGRIYRLFPAHGSKFSTRYQIYKASGAPTPPGPFGSLASLADNDNITIPDIHARIAAKPRSNDRGRHEALHQHHPRHPGDLRHGADSRRRVRHGQPGQRDRAASPTKARSTR